MEKTNQRSIDCDYNNPIFHLAWSNDMEKSLEYVLIILILLMIHRRVMKNGIVWIFKKRN